MLASGLKSTVGQQPLKANVLYHGELTQRPHICSLRTYGNSPKHGSFWGCFPALIQLQLITTNRVLCTADRLVFLDHLFSMAMSTICPPLEDTFQNF